MCESINTDLNQCDGVELGARVLSSVDDGDAIAGLNKLTISVPAPRDVSG